MNDLESELFELALKLERRTGRLNRKPLVTKLRQLATAAHWYTPPRNRYRRGDDASARTVAKC